ncbi:hypothetical protein E2L06_18315 [Haloterrigena sp. H1]|uniref:hypothetical protein n=1 Tax=Haloterrigena sp. H1 TaxID=2552943 RepID=UPI00110D4331|nr:hypothetical protein [Haloterrigena sp. H1]TMT78030.1 hypothetical protein E2L06_20980 [Haloterrigena sp. H1]TMT80217.1 hypothetical protein E2L06_18315 [Haloterrigena sp. H1]
MKKGAGSDPFGDNVDDTDDQNVEEDVDNVVDDGLEEETEDKYPSDDASIEEVVETVNDGVAPDLPQSGRDDGGIPWVYTRDNVKQDRDMVQFYLRSSVQDVEGKLVDAVEDELGASVSKTDVREAAYVAAMRQPEIVAEELERWGFENE